MTIKRLDHVSVVVHDLDAAVAFFTALGMTVEGKAPIEGAWVDRINALDGVRVDIVMMRTPDGHGRLELTKFRNPPLVELEPAIAPPNERPRRGAPQQRYRITPGTSTAGSGLTCRTTPCHLAHRASAMPPQR